MCIIICIHTYANMYVFSLMEAAILGQKYIVEADGKLRECESSQKQVTLCDLICVLRAQDNRSGNDFQRTAICFQCNALI